MSAVVLYEALGAVRKQIRAHPFFVLIITDQVGIPVLFNTKRKHTKNQALKEKNTPHTHITEIDRTDI